MEIISVGNCLSGGNILEVKEIRYYYTDKTVIDIKKDMVLLFGEKDYIKVSDLEEINSNDREIII